jgi:cysteinyl-tRNA synthetase
MDDDLATPAAVAVIFETMREGNKLLADGDEDGARAAAVAVHAMLDVLGLDPADPHWGAPAASDGKLEQAVDVLVRSMLDQRAEARAAKDWATADAIRDRLAEAGVEVEDTPTGPKWSV